MPLEMQPFTKDDAQEGARLVAESFQSNPFRRIVFPNGMAEATREKTAASQIKAVEDPTKHIFKVIDTETGEMAACAIWQETKAMGEEDWAREREGAMDPYPDARRDLLEEFVLIAVDKRQKVKKDQRWWGEY